MNSVGDLIYSYLLNIVNKYQENYTGEDKMTREEIMLEIGRFKKG